MPGFATSVEPSLHVRPASLLHVAALQQKPESAQEELLPPPPPPPLLGTGLDDAELPPPPTQTIGFGTSAEPSSQEPLPSLRQAAAPQQ